MPDPSNEGVRRSADAKAPFAYVTLVTNADYAMGALALARSVFLTGSPADVVVLYTGGTPEESLKQLEANWKAATITLSEEVLAKIDAIHVKKRNPNLTD